eukprot:1868292-Amphidinium_carterae.1
MKVYRWLDPSLENDQKSNPEPKTQSPLAAPARVPVTDAPFRLGEHKRVVKHADFLQRLDCSRQAGNVKATGK